MPRRVYTYRPETGWEGLNQLATAGAILIALGGVVFLVNVYRSLRHGQPAGDNPWDADSLEWGTASPPPNCNLKVRMCILPHNSENPHCARISWATAQRYCKSRLYRRRAP